VPKVSEDGREPFALALLEDIARLFIRLKRPQEGRLAFEEIRSRERSREADHAWALLSAAAGRENDVRTWLRSVNRATLSPPFLRDLVFIAMDGKAFDAAADGAQRLVAVRGLDSDRMLLAEATAAAGRPWVRLAPRNPPAASP
jgi:hypothetical protein